MCTLTQTQKDAEKLFQEKESLKIHKYAHQVGGCYEKYIKLKQQV